MRLAVGEQHGQPPAAGLDGPADHLGERRLGRLAAGQQVQVSAQSSAESVGASSWASAPGIETPGQPRRDGRPAGDRAVVAEQPRPGPEWRGRGLAAGHADGRRPDRGQQRAGPDHPGQVGERLVGPDRPGAAVPGRFGETVDVPTDPEPVGVDHAVLLAARRPGLPDQRERRIGQQRAQQHRLADVGEVTAHGSALPGCGVARTAEAGEDLPADRVVPVPERAPAGHPVGGERAAAQHLVLGAEEHLRVLPVRPGGETRIGR